MSPTEPAPPGTGAPAFTPSALEQAAHRFRETAHVVRHAETGHVGVAFGDAAGHAVLATLPPLYPEWLGDRGFTEAHRLRFPYVGGAMANGITTTRMVEELGRAGCLAFFGAAGLPLDRVEQAVGTLREHLGADGSWGSNLIHSPGEPGLEEATADLYLRAGVRRVSASAFMALTPAVVRYAATGLRQGPDGRVQRANHVFAKISRPEVARAFLEPAPAAMLEALVRAGRLAADEARLAARVPVAEDLTVEADSGGHTDNRPLLAQLPTIAALRDRVAAERGYDRPIRLGAAGGLGTPGAVAAAFALGAAYVLTGSVNQACVESGLSEAGRRMLAQAGLADVAMCPAADMFEQGVQVQVLTRGTLFAARARTLYELYRAHDRLDDLPPAARSALEGELLRQPLDRAWEATRAWWQARDPRIAERGDTDEKHRMALVFRAYLGQASRWAVDGVPDRTADYQIWCGPAMGAFNAWTQQSFLAEPARRTVVQVARNLLEGAAVLTRAWQLRSYGAPMPALDFRPRPLG